MLANGTLLAKRYRIEEKLGEGGMGVVYRAHDTLLDRDVAIKTISSQLLSDEGLKRLLREAQAAAKLTHPNIVAIHDIIDDGNTRLIVMEYVSGRILRDLIPLPYEQALGVAGQVALALDYAHAHGVVHRDIKPENVIVTANGFAKVMDFGLARSEGRSRLTQTGMIVGTVAYMAPEQALSGQADARSDLYSLGAVLYETITGKPPFQADDPISVISMHVNVPPISPRFYTPEVPAVLESVILRLLAKDPTKRYATAEEVNRVLKTIPMSVDAPGQGISVHETQPAPSTLFDLMSRGRLIGREEELASLKSTLEAVLSGRGQVILIAGEPGIGKTRLAEELLVYARLRGCLALVGHCYEQEMSIPYLSFSEALRPLFRSPVEGRLVTLTKPYAAELVKLVPELAQRIPEISPSPPIAPDQERLRLFVAVNGFLADFARGQPLVLMIDDLQWADATTLQLLRNLARNIRADRVLIVGTYRDVEVDRTHPLSFALSEMNRERLYKRVLVRGLTTHHVAAMIQAIFQASQPVSDEFRDLIYRETEGNPFFVEEILKHLVEIGALYIEEEGRWGRKPIDQIDVPQSVREVIGRRLERVSERCQRVLSLAAIIGRRFRFETLQAVGELGEQEVLEALEEAMAAQLIQEKSRAVTGEEYDFVHALVREVLYERLSGRRRRMLHERVGQALERLYADRSDEVVEDLAYHFTHAPQGEGLEKAIRYSLEAARKAMSLSAHEEAVKYYQNATELLEEAKDEQRLAQTQVALGEPFDYLADSTSAVAAYKRALSFYERQGNSIEIARVHGLIGRTLQRHWNFSEAIPYLEHAVQHLDVDEHSTELMQIQLDLSRALAFSERTTEAKKHASAALALATERENLFMQSEAYLNLGVIFSFNVLTREEAQFHYEEGLRRARVVQDPRAYYVIGRCLNNIALLHVERGQPGQAIPLLLEAIGASQRARDVQQISFLNMQLAGYCHWQGDWQAARRYTLDTVNVHPSLLHLKEAEFYLRVLDGKFEDAISLAEEVLGEERRGGNRQRVFFWSAHLAWLNLELDRPQEARNSATDAVAFGSTTSRYLWPPFAFVPKALARYGDHAACEALCANVETLSRTAKSPMGLASALLGRAELAHRRGNLDEAIQLLREDLPFAQQHGKVLYASALLSLGQALRQRRLVDDVDHAKEVLNESLMLFEQMGNARKASQVREALESPS